MPDYHDPNDVPHILQHKQNQTPKQPTHKLVFTKRITPYGIEYPPLHQPNTWDNVHEISKGLYLAWSNDDEKDARVYVGAFQKI